MLNEFRWSAVRTPYTLYRSSAISIAVSNHLQTESLCLPQIGLLHIIKDQFLQKVTLYFGVSLHAVHQN